MKTILVVDDNEDSRELVKKDFKKNKDMKL